MKTIIIFLLYFAGFIIWIFNVLIPYTSKILLHIQNHSNLNTQLDLIYCAKQVLFGFLWTLVLGVCIWLISFILVKTRN